MKYRIGIITFHSSINYGAFLQAFSLYKAIKKDIEAEIEIINYTPFNKKIFYILKVLSTIRKKHFTKMFKQYIAFRRAGKLLPLSKKIKYQNYLKQCNYLNQNYSAIIIGSDEVLSAGKTKLKQFPDIYWPDETVSIPKLTYAGSANRSDYHKLSIKEKEITRRIFANYSYVGIRDHYTLEQIGYIDPDIKPQFNCDPTFLIDFNEEYPDIKNRLSEKLSKLTEKPIIALMIKNDSIGQLIRRHFGDKYYLLALYYPNKAADYFYSDMSPLEWAVGFSLYAGCISQLFHATVFSIKNKIPFISIDNNPLYDGRSSKISDILTRTELSDNYFNLRSDSCSNDLMISQFKANLENPQTERMDYARKNQVSLYQSFIYKLRLELGLIG